MHANHTHRHPDGAKNIVQRLQARRGTLHRVSRTLELLALLALARRIGLKRGRRLAALAAMTVLDGSARRGARGDHHAGR